MQDQFLVVRCADNLIHGLLLQDSPDAGPIIPQGDCPIAGACLVSFDGEFSRAGRRDTEEAYWVGETIEWRETLSLEALRAERSAAINAWKLEANNTYFDFAGEQIAYKESDRIEIQAVHNWVTLTGTMPDWPDWPGAWKAISNRWVPLPDVETWKAFTLAIASRGTAHFKHAQMLKSDLAAATTVAEIEAIQW